MLDAIIIGIVAIGCIRGFIKGAINQIAALGGLVAGLLLARLFYTLLADKLVPILGSSHEVARIVAFIAIAVVVPTLCSWGGLLLTRFFQVVKLNLPNRLIGALLGGVLMALVLGIFLNVLQLIDSGGRLIALDRREQCVFYYPLQESTSALIRCGIEKSKEIGPEKLKMQKESPAQSPKSPKEKQKQEKKGNKEVSPRF